MDRRLAAIVAADVVGYSSLVSDDEEGTLRALKGHLNALEPMVGLNGGRIFKTMGDGFLAEFQSVVDAVACAETMQRRMVERNGARGDGAEMLFRMGIHVGDVVADGDDILGDGVNIAARLEGIADPGGVVVSRRVYEDVVGKLDLAFDDLGPQTLKNIARPMPAYSIRISEVAATTPTPVPIRPEKPSVAVLAFDNLSSDPEQDYFADGITEDIITGLSRVPWIFVIARNSSFSYKGLSVDIRRIGRELGVRYVLEGSVRKAGNRLRVTGQLVDAETGNHIWADRYDGLLEDVFDLQDRITEAVVAAIAPGIRQAEIERALRKRPDRLDAYDHLLRAQAAVGRFRMGEAIGHLDHAIACAPDYTLAKGMRAWMDTLVWHVDIPSTDERFASAATLASDVLSQPGDDLEAEVYAGYVLAFTAGEIAPGLRILRRATELCPSYAFAWASSCIIHGFQGDCETAIAHGQEALRLSPRDPLSFRVYLGMGHALCASQDWEGLLALTERAREYRHAVTSLRYYEITANVHLGRTERARELANQFRTLAPDQTVTRILESRRRIRVVAPGFYEQLGVALITAGIPE